MKAYEENRAAYFATPPVNLVYAYRASLELILRSNTLSFDERIKLHIRAKERIGEGAEKLGLRFVAEKLEERANGMTAVRMMLQPAFIAVLMNG
jgi:alanine-glyoxylate transaminase / serine-glyoxylate transaminase / serine-pyruvate transaminase